MMKPPSILLVLVLLVPAPKSCKGDSLPVDCSDVQHQVKNPTSGVFTIYPAGPTSAIQVFCDLDSQEGRWTVLSSDCCPLDLRDLDLCSDGFFQVFQRRMDGTVNFYRGWDQYKSGFGNAFGEYWLGLENIHQIVRQRNYELLVDMEDFEGNQVFARYSAFNVDAECDGYALHVSGFKDGGAGDSLIRHNGNKFSTFDKDQDKWSANCARSFLGAFWYDKCHVTNPNGVYRWGPDGTVYAVGVSWYSWKRYDYSLKTISMKIRPVH